MRAENRWAFQLPRTCCLSSRLRGVFRRRSSCDDVPQPGGPLPSVGPSRLLSAPATFRPSRQALISALLAGRQLCCAVGAPSKVTADTVPHMAHALMHLRFWARLWAE